ncbi:MAG TPA: hypothetical protein VFV01_17120 [Spirillospora sp.]|nr:hypothetical protein [Spirillospora sp.]
MAEDRTGVVARLDALEAAHKGATSGPWQYDPETPGEVWDSDERYPHVLGGCEESADAAAIVAEHNATPALIAAVRGVLDLHHRIGEGEPGREVDYCDYDGFVWPCAEYRDLAAALGEA